MKFTTSSEESINGLVDSLLGLGKKFNVTDIKSFDKRFNISVPIQELSSETAVFEITNVKSDSKGNIKFTNNHNGKTIRFPCEIFMNPVLFKVPKEFAKIRINCDQFDITLGLFNGKLNYTFNNVIVDCNLYKIRDIAMLMEWLWDCECEIDISLHIDEISKSIEYSANNNIKNSKDQNFINNIHILNGAVKNAITIAEHMGLESYLITNTDNLMRNCRNLNYISRMISGDLTSMVFKFNADHDHKFKEKISDVCCIIVISFTMHDIKVDCITSFTGKATPSDIEDEYLLTSPKIDELKMIESKIGNNSSAEIKKEIDRICSKFESKEITIVDFFNKET